jgi:hypothetical protein
MLWSQYKLVTIIHTEFLRKQITEIPNFANRNSDFLTLQTSEFQKKSNQNLLNRKQNRNSPYKGVPEIGTENWNSQPRFIVSLAEPFCSQEYSIRSSDRAEIGMIAVQNYRD